MTGPADLIMLIRSKLLMRYHKGKFDGCILAAVVSSAGLVPAHKTDQTDSSQAGGVKPVMRN